MQPPTYHLGPDFDEKLTSFVNALESASTDIFASEFGQIEQFVAGAKADKSEREDHLLRRTDAKLYLLEAIAYKMYDKVNREQFNQTKETLIILPDCLSLHNPDCSKVEGKWGDICRGCTPDCQADQAVQLASKYGAHAIFSKRKLAEQLEHFDKQSKSLGVIGVACLLMLAEGMRTAMKLGIPVRGVPLDYCGCEHWNAQPFASAFPIAQLKKILEEKYGNGDPSADHSRL
jgi:hypothetical protein